jgi:hypothetical protein
MYGSKVRILQQKAERLETLRGNFQASTMGCERAINPTSSGPMPLTRCLAAPWFAFCVVLRADGLVVVVACRSCWTSSGGTSRPSRTSRRSATRTSSWPTSSPSSRAADPGDRAVTVSRGGVLISRPYRTRLKGAMHDRLTLFVKRSFGVAAGLRLLSH